MQVSRAILCALLGVVLVQVLLAQESPPKITFPLQQEEKLVVDDQRLDLKCTADGNPPPKYRWERDGVQLTESSSLIMNHTSGELSVPQFTFHEEGRYQCFAANEIRGRVVTALSPIFDVKRVYIESEWISNIQTVKAKQGLYAQLPCTNQPKSVPAATYVWYITDGTNSEDVKNNDRLFIDGVGTLHFIKAELSDQPSKPEEIYKCGVYNGALNIIKLGADTDLQVSANTGASSKPQLKYPEKNAEVVVMRNTDAVLECVFSGNPVPDITWTHPLAYPIENSEKHEFTAGTYKRRLVIKTVDIEDDGRYTCKGKNSAGEETTTIKLKVVSGPIWVKGLSSQIAVEGRDAVFTCLARPLKNENPLNPPTWMKNGVQLQPGTEMSKYEFSQNAGVLTVKKVNKVDDIACFQCNVSNEYGYKFGDGCLNIIDPIVITSEPTLRQVITKGDIVNLTVTGTSDPGFPLKYRWHFKNVTYDLGAPPHVIYDEKTKVAYINTSGLTDEAYGTINGTYYRVLYHEHDKVTVPIDVILTDAPAVVGPVVPGTANLWWVALIVALVVLIIVIILIAFICNRKRQEGTYPLDKKERNNDLDPEKDLADSGFQDLSYAPGDGDFPSKKTPGINPNFDYGDDIDMGDDDESLMEYGGGDIDTTKFNEDGSFIGQYSSKNQTPQVQTLPMNHHTESQI